MRHSFNLLAGTENQSWCRKAARGRNGSQGTIGRCNHSQKVQQQARRVAGRFAAARGPEDPYSGTAAVPAAESLKWSRLEIMLLFFKKFSFLRKFLLLKQKKGIKTYYLIYLVMYIYRSHVHSS